MKTHTLKAYKYIEDENGYKKYIEDRKAFFESEDGKRLKEKIANNSLLNVSAKNNR